jgi:peptide/nickel transport system permease protein
MATFLIRRAIAITIMMFLVSVAAYLLFINAPGGPWEQLLNRGTSDRNRLDPGAVDRLMRQFDLDLDHGIRYARWLTGYPRGPIVINGQEMFAGTPIGCMQPAAEGTKVRLQYSDGTVVETDCLRPTYLKDLMLPERRVSQGALRLDFGVSQLILKDRPVIELIRQRLPSTLLLMGISTLLAIVIAVPIGVICAVKQYSRLDNILTSLTFFFSGMPTLFLGIMFILFFGVFIREQGLPYLPTGLETSPRDTTVPIIGDVKAASLVDRIWHLVMPVTVLTVVSLTGWSRFIRSSMLEVLKMDFVRTARAKGLNERFVIAKHAFRNGMIPFVTLLGGVLPGLFGGAIVTETIFSWPGLGRLYAQALNGDYSVAMAILIISTFLTYIGFLISDVLYTIVDPRIRIG